MMSDKQRILIVDDEPQITRVLRRSLTTHGYEVRVTSDGLAALQTFGDWPPDLVVTDLSMPNTDGLQLCRNLRAISQLPIIVLSVRGEERTKVQALDAGADDYVTKPFGMDELLARIRAALRRACVAKTDDVLSPVLEVGNFRIDLENRHVAVKGTEVHLTPKEYDLMVYLVSHPGKVLTHRTLLTSIWGGESMEQTENLRVFVGQLRKKIEPEPATPRYILTEPWIGYRFDPGA
ncbi:MAG: two-component system, OmpR family, operon response regulator KdpE [Acidobacteriota bacterium]|nr:two-component system, OmpR family, operon response regulator KdpE [Acidobacteriota bacterium]MDT5263054.1 two-component system, OmpR family, operon response regulator KdpE [Acidobacteriota bacterium]MDT7781532.1 two-component system, OmpR family, operon response regulator KdpE [Acidobacteriota bacterium]